MNTIIEINVHFLKCITLVSLIITVISCGSVPNNNGYYPYTVEQVNDDIYLIEFRGTSLSTELEAREQWDFKAKGVCQGNYQYLTSQEYRKYRNKSIAEITSKYGCKDSLECILVSLVSRDSGEIKYPEASGAAICMLADNKVPEIRADDIDSVEIALPSGIEWELATNELSKDEYVKEWIPKGESINSYSWIIALQKIHFGHSDPALTTHKILFNVARKACVDASFDGPKQIDINGHITSVGRAMCSSQKGKGYGSFMDQRIIASGDHSFIVTSELRTPPSNKAGFIKFENEDFNAPKFMDRQNISSKFIRQNIKVCFKSTGTCE